MVPQNELQEIIARLLLTQQQVIDLKDQIDREHQAGLGFRRFGESAFRASGLDTFFSIAIEEVVATFGTENAVMLRLGPEGIKILANCCAEETSIEEMKAFEKYIHKISPGDARVLSSEDLPHLLGRPTGVILVGTYVDNGDPSALYAVIATVSKMKMPFYPKFTPQVGNLYAAFLSHIGVLQQHLRNRERSTKLFRAMQHFVPKEFLQALGHTDITTARLGDATLKNLTVLFADIRDFTQLSESMTPAETAGFLNACLSRIGPHIRAHGGFVDKYIGDAIMALFPRSPRDAVNAAIAMQSEMAASRQFYSGGVPLWIGVGIHMGDVMMCTVGEEERFEVTVISDAVNLTARLESLTKLLKCPILISGAVEKHLTREVREFSRPLGSFAVKGKTQSVDISEIFITDNDELRKQKADRVDDFKHAQNLFRSGKTKEALKTLKALVKASPQDGPLSWWLKYVQESGDSEGDRKVIRLDRK